MPRTQKAKAPALARGGFSKTVSSALTDRRHSTRSHVGRKQDVHGQCPVCNTRGYLKALSVSLDGLTQRGEVCPSCYAAAAVSTAYGQSIAHRFAQTKHHCAVKKEFTPC